MKLVLASDTHGEHRYGHILWPDGDILVHAGDFTSTGGLSECADFILWAAAVQEHYEHVVFIAGNHDYAMQFETTAIDELLMKHSKLHYLRDSGCEIEGIKFYGTPWQPMYGGMAFNVRFEKELQRYWQRIPTSVDVLITHTPPRNILDMAYDGEHIGSISLTTEVFDRIKPKRHVFGHVHEQGGLQWMQDGIRFTNAAGLTPIVVKI